MPNLLPCPFCGSDTAAPTEKPPFPFIWIHCMQCGASGANGSDEAEAEAAWNTRATLKYPHDTLSQTMELCEHCGNKRCPHATDNRYRCTGSNATGQVGEIDAPTTKDDQ